MRYLMMILFVSTMSLATFAQKTSESFGINYSRANQDDRVRVLDLRKHSSSQYVQMAGMVVDTFFGQNAYHVDEVDSFSVSRANLNFGYEHHGKKDTLFLTFRKASTGNYSVSSEVLKADTLLIDSTSFAGPNAYHEVRNTSIDFPDEPVFKDGAVALTIEFAGTDSSRFGIAFGFNNLGACQGASNARNVSSGGSPFYPRSFYQYRGTVYPYQVQRNLYRDCNSNGQYDADANEEPLLQNLMVGLDGTLYPDKQSTGKNRESIRNEEFKLHPNPAQSYLTWHSNYQVQQLKILDLQGQEVETYHAPGNKVFLGIPSGLYVAEVKTRQRTYHVKFVKN